jgi:predicted AAA+ superfamily ATPase
MLSNVALPSYTPKGKVLAQRLEKPRRFIQVVTGPRQVGKTALNERIYQAVRVHHYTLKDLGAS